MCKYDQLLLVGSYTRDGISEGIYVYLMDSVNMHLKQSYIEKQVSDPSSFYYLEERQLLIVANEDQRAPYFSSYRVNLEHGKLEFISKIDLPGTETCDVSVSPDERWVFGANYQSGSLVWVRMEKDGTFSESAKEIRYYDSSVNKERQTQSYIHSTAFVGDTLYVMNLGGDCIYRYDLESKEGDLISCKSQSIIRTEKGEGPRQILVHPNGKWVYLLTEMGNHLIQYEVQSDGQLKELSMVCMLPEYCEIECRASVLRLSPDGSCIFAAVRDYDALVKYKINPNTGELFDRQFYPTHGEHPRSFEFTLNGNYIMICNQFSNSLVICRFNKETNEVGEVVQSLAIPDCSYIQTIARYK